ncbi:MULTISPECIES: LysR family transcriptional regulator [Lysobacter]|uniref:LysR family transcriptional regulator n=1 Tax=Lysobacter TaxID=68 RepID=UPI001F3B8869|nr:MULTISPECIES: LysR family transcriptional regulator [Lysobacter]UJB21047.1 LysR family transcriptional regulator [Lysobacter capsici]UJQ29838.1 LysR family transcriptional regulator [Lysobacter gummosus]
MIDNLPNLLAFDRIVRAGSLSAAARELDLSLAVVSKRLTQLESALGVRLLQRTTRRQTLTEEGRLLHAQVVRILAEVEAAEALMSQQRASIGGLLRITAPHDLGRRWIAPILADFQRQHPQLRVHLQLSDALIDLVGEGLDLAVRFGSLADSSLIARPLAPNHRVVCAAPAYLREHGEPAHPADLIRHRCIVIGDSPSAEWRFIGDEPVSVRIDAELVSNDGGVVLAWALAGAGIALKSIWDVGDDLAAGRLRRVLPDYAVAAAPLHAIYPHSAHLAPRVRAFVDYLRERLQAAWRWESPPGA